MNFMLVLIFIILSLHISHQRKRKPKTSRKLLKGVDPKLLGPKELEKLRSRQNPWENGDHYQGDVAQSRLRTAIADRSYRWSSREIPYEVSNKFTADERNTIVKALNIIGNKTCVKPRPRIRTDKESILFVTEQGSSCYSVIGSMHILQQKIYLDPFEGCVKEPTILHEFMHALGLFHEQSAPDRDKYIQINWENIRNDMWFNFEKSAWTTTRFGLPYDYDSIMHYSAYAFSKNGQRTIVSKSPSRTLTKNRQLSKTDVMKINKMYNCD